jgi:ribose transport system substrate-binding protein
MMRRKLGGLLLLFALAMAACGGDDEGADAPASNTEDYELLFIPGSLGNDFFFTIWQGAKERASELGISIKQQGSTEYDPSAQIPIINAALANPPDAILIAATDAEALQAPLEQAADRGVKIVTLDTGVREPHFVETHVSSDIRRAGSLIADHLLQLTDDQGPVMYIDHAPGVAFAEELRAGFEQRIAETPQVELLPIQYFDIDPAKSESITRTTITSHPDLAGAFVGVDIGLEGAIPALQAAGKADQVKTIAFDAFIDTIKRLRAGEVDAVGSVAARDYGVAAVDSAVDALNGKNLSPEVTPKFCILTAENVDDPSNEPCLYQPVKR